MSWQKIVLSAPSVSKAEHVQIQSAFENVFMGAGGSKDMALFSSNVGTGGEEFLTLYFSPAAAPYVSSLSGNHTVTTCDCPDKENVSLLVGDSDAWDLLN